VSERDRLLRLLHNAIRPRPKPRRIVCYDAAWAGLPRVTIHDRPRRRKVGRWKRERVAARPRPTQLELAL
jgi:hypothetical protein